MAVINGANTVDAAVARAKAGFMRMLAVRVIVFLPTFGQLGE